MSNQTIMQRHTQRAHKHGSRSELTEEVLRRFWEKYEGKGCLCCGGKEDLRINHVLPLSRGGSNKLRNLQLLCRKHCDEKGNRWIDYRCNPPAIYGEKDIEHRLEMQAKARAKQRGSGGSDKPDVQQ